MTDKIEDSNAFVPVASFAAPFDDIWTIRSAAVTEFLFRKMSSSLSLTLTPRSTCRKSRTSGGSEIRQES